MLKKVLVLMLLIAVMVPSYAVMAKEDNTCTQATVIGTTILSSFKVPQTNLAAGLFGTFGTFYCNWLDNQSNRVIPTPTNNLDYNNMGDFHFYKVK